MDVTVYFSDRLNTYAELIPPDRLVQTKKETYGIENNNGRQRHWFARFRRRTCVVSRSWKMVDLTMALFARFHCNRPSHLLFDLFSLS